VARDAGAAARTGSVLAAGREGRLLVWPEGKDRLGTLLGCEAVAVVGVVDDGMAAGLRALVALRETFEAPRAPERRT
jgi:hypothetical protein